MKSRNPFLRSILIFLSTVTTTMTMRTTVNARFHSIITVITCKTDDFLVFSRSSFLLYCFRRDEYRERFQKQNANTERCFVSNQQQEKRPSEENKTQSEARQSAGRWLAFLFLFWICHGDTKTENRSIWSTVCVERTKKKANR